MPTAHEMNIIAESWKNNLGLTPDEIHARFFAMQRKSQGLDPYGDASDPNRQSRVQLLKSVDIKAEQQRKSAQTPLTTTPNLGLDQNIFGLRPKNAVDTSAPLLNPKQLQHQQARDSRLLGVSQVKQNLQDQQDAQQLSPFKMPVNQYQKGPFGIGHVPTPKSFRDNISQAFSNTLDNATDSASQLATSPLSKYMQAHPFTLPQGSPDDGVPAAQRGLEDAGQPASSVSLGELMKASAALPEANKGFLQQIFHNSIYKKPLLDGAGTAWQKDLNASYSPTGVTSGIVPPEWRNSLSFKSPLGDAHSVAPAIEAGSGALLDPANILGVGEFGAGAKIVNGLSREAILGSTEAGLAERAAAFSGMSAAQKAGAFPRLATRQAAERLVHGPVNNANIKLTGNPKITAALDKARVTAQDEARARHAIPQEPETGIGEIPAADVAAAKKNLSSAKGNAKKNGQNPVKTVISPASNEDIANSVLPQPLPEPELSTASAPAAPAPEALVPPVPKVLGAVDSDGVNFRSPVVPTPSPLLDARGNPVNSSAPSVILDSKGNPIKVVGKDISSLPASPPANTDEFDPFEDLRNVFDTTPAPTKAPVKTPEPASHTEVNPLDDPEDPEDEHDFNVENTSGASAKMVPSVETSYGGSGGLYDRSEHGSNPFVRPGGRLRTFFISPHDRATTGPIQTPYGSTFHVDGGLRGPLQPENYDKVSLAQKGDSTARRVSNASASAGMTALMLGSKTQTTTGVQYSQFYKQWLEDAQKYEEAGSSPDIKGALESMKAGYSKTAANESAKLLSETNPYKIQAIKEKLNILNNFTSKIDPSDPDGLSKLIEDSVQYGSFDSRGALMKTIGSPTYAKKFNLPSKADVLDRYEDPKFKDYPAGHIPMMGFPSQLNPEVRTAKEIGSKPNGGYPFVIQGAAPVDLPTRPGTQFQGFHLNEIIPYGSGRISNYLNSALYRKLGVVRNDMPTFNLPPDVVERLGLPVGEHLPDDNALAVAAGTVPKNTGHEEAFSGQYPGPKELVDNIRNSQYSLISAFTSATDNKAGKLIEDIKALGGKITPVDGSYNGVTESSFRVDGLTPVQVDTLASQYKQDSVIHADGQGGFVLHSTNADKPFADVQGNGVKFGSQVKSTEPGYSTMYSHQGPIDFSINFDGAAKGSQAAALPGVNEGLTGVPATLPSGKVLPKDTSEPDLPGISNALSGEPAPLLDKTPTQLTAGSTPDTTPTEKMNTSYSALKSGIKDQWNFLKNNGVKFEPQSSVEEGYPNSQAMQKDAEGGHLSYFTGGDMDASHPLAEIDKDTGESYNNMLRAVHDYFGHAAEGNQFGANGEENAWQAHARMFDPAALPALTAETRMQNSFVNFGSHMRGSDGSLLSLENPGYLTAKNRPFARQSAFAAPDEFSDTSTSLSGTPIMGQFPDNEPARLADKYIAQSGLNPEPKKSVRVDPELAKKMADYQSAQPIVPKTTSAPPQPHELSFQDWSRTNKDGKVALAVPGGYKYFEKTYIRFGDIPTDKAGNPLPSMNGLSGTREKGSSVYEAWKDPETGKYVLPGGTEQYSAGNAEFSERPAYEVDGLDTGHSGDDGEPLLNHKTVKVVKSIPAKDITSEDEPGLSLDGNTEFKPSETPDINGSKYGNTYTNENHLDIVNKAMEDGKVVPQNVLDSHIELSYPPYSEAYKTGDGKFRQTVKQSLPGISNALAGEPVLPSGQALAKTNADGTPVASWNPNTTKNEDGYRQHDLLVGPDAAPRDLKHEVAHPIWQYMTDAERATMNPILNAATPAELAEARLGRNVAPGSPITDADRSELFANGAQNMMFGNEAAPTSLAGKIQQNLVGPMQRLGYSARQFVPGLSNPISTNPEIQNLILSYTKKNPYSNPLHQESPIGMNLRDDLRDSVTYDSPEDCVNATGGKDKPVLVPNDSVYGSMSGRWIAPKDMAYVNSIFNDNIHYLPFEGLNRSAPAGSPDAPTGAYQGTLPPGLVNLTRFGKSMTTTKSGKLGHYTHIATGDQLAALLNANYSVQNGNGALDYLKNLPAGFKESMANTGPNIDALSKLSPIVGHGTMGAMGGVDEDGPLGKLATWYKATENWPKITLYKTLVDSGIAPEEAAARVADSQIDYGGLPGIVKYAAQSGAMPFLNYSYGSTRFMLNLMAENPSLIRKLGELRQSQFDGYPGSQQQYQNARDYQQNPGVVPTGYDPKTGAANLTNISPALPGTADGLGIPFPNSFALPKTPTLPGVIDAFGQNVNNAEGSITNGVTQLPLVGGLASAVLNKNRYGEPLIDNNTPAGVAGIKDASAITSSLYPQGVTSIGERVFDAINGTPRVQNGGPGSVVGGTSKSVETWPSVFSNWVGAPQSFETPDNPYKVDYNKAIEGMRVANSKYKYEAARGGISPLTSMQRQEALDAYESAKVKYYGPTQVPGQPFVPRVNNADTYPLNPQFLGLPSDSIPPQQPTPSDSTPLIPPAPAAPNQPPPGGYAPSL